MAVNTKQAMKTVAFRLEPALGLRLQAIAIERECTLSDLIRSIVHEWVTKRGR